MRPYVVSHMSYASRSSFRDDIQSQLDGLDYEWPKFGSCNLKNTKNKLSFKLGSELAEEQGILVGAAEEQSGLTCRPIRQLIRRNIASHSLATRADDGDDDLEPVIDEDIPETEDEDDDIEMYERRRDQIGGRRSRRSGNARPSGNTQTIELPVATTASTASLALLPERNQYMAATLPTIKGSRLTVVVFGEISIVADIKESLISSASLVRMFIGVGPDSRSTEFVQVRDEIGGYKGRKKTSKVGVGLGNSIHFKNPLRLLTRSRHTTQRRPEMGSRQRPQTNDGYIVGTHEPRFASAINLAFFVMLLRCSNCSRFSQSECS